VLKDKDLEFANSIPSFSYPVLAVPQVAITLVYRYLPIFDKPM